SETPEGNLKWLAATSTAGTSDRLAAAKATFSTESARSCHLITSRFSVLSLACTGRIRCLAYYETIERQFSRAI
ncbi:hypothetical protein ACSETL_35920, partial [Pseudomonas aeruginosa]